MIDGNKMDIQIIIWKSYIYEFLIFMDEQNKILQDHLTKNNSYNIDIMHTQY